MVADGEFRKGDDNITIIILLLAHCGDFVPWDRVKVGPADPSLPSASGSGMWISGRTRSVTARKCEAVI